MSILSRTAWKALYGNTGSIFPDNTTGEISEGDMRTFGENASDSFFQKSDDSYTAPFPQVTAAGTDTYTATLSPAITAYAAGQKFQILFTNGNTGAATLNLNTLGALAITKNGATALDAGDIQAGSIKILSYDGTRLQMIGGGSSSGGTTIPYGTTSGTNTITATMSPTVTAYAETDLYRLQVTTSTTGLATINLDGVGAKKAYLTPDTQLSIGDVVGGHNYLFTYRTSLDGGAGGFLFVGDYNHQSMNYRGGFNASGGAFPSTGGTGTGGAIRTFDTWAISVGGTLGGIAVNSKDFIIAIGDNPTDVLADWLIIYGHASMDTKLALKADLTALDSYVNEETFATLTFASPTVWACNSRQMPLAKLTATGDFTIDMTNVKSGSQGILKVTASTASAFTITFDTDFTNVEATTNASLLTYTFPADNGQFYLLNFVCDGTILHWTILDVQTENPIPFAQIGRAAAQSINNNDSTVFVTMDTETHDNATIWAVSPNPTRFTIPGSGDKVATISIRAQWAANATGVRRNIPYLNGSTTGDIAQTTGITGVSVIHNSTHQVACAGGDYIEILCYQNSGGALSLDACGVRIQIHDR